ncbi:DUF4238 domain-containing protein [Bradyrhizobium iriomotense]|uniref:DUF4238 domain-containing protein n=1 Tax=Bradyrhizobium iriomotense TaxID=441950 RepID=A0ABQ6BFH2_9BRAD|nr:DUF4238 domain-containing protein [Bradyrhizobium iriomotense]GLR90917.1 hypothetical protein GCM10007857_76330 [Bradyrhizobium iriomotense]
MSKTRNNHYVPQWHQEGFFEPGRNKLAYLDLTPPQKVLSDGRVITERALFEAPTSRAFRQMDLYSTFFGTSVNDEIERRLFGDIDAKGSLAVRAFATDDVGEWHRHFQKLFEYIDIQKIRTPKGLAWLSAQYPTLTQNDLMFEMQGIRLMHCTIWTEGVREIVSAEDAKVKFIVSDHPVTIYNHAVPPTAPMCAHPHDPTIALKASQTIFPLNRDFCLILTNLEYAQDPATASLDKRTFARNYRSSMVRTDAFIRTRKLSDHEVARINYVLKSRAHRYVAAGRKEWLFPEKVISESWADLRETLLPPKNQLWHFGGEMFAKFDSGDVHFQDAFGRTEPERDFLKKQPPTGDLKPGDRCGCGSGQRFKVCCALRPAPSRPTWQEASIRERNVMLYNGIVNVLALDAKKDWVTVRRELTDEKIALIYELFEGLWPLETDLLQLLPRPDGFARAVYTGMIHPNTITQFALGASLYFGELIVEHPFVHAGTMKKEFSPVANPHSYRQEILKTLIFFLTVIPLVEQGLVNLVPDPCNFDPHLRDQMFRMAHLRSAGVVNTLHQEVRLDELARENLKRSLMMLPKEALRSQLLRASPELDDIQMEQVLEEVERLKEDDPLAVLQPDSLAGGKEGGQYDVMKLAPNFEMTLYLAQATGAAIVTDNPFRWKEIRRAAHRRGSSNGRLPSLARNIGSSTFTIPQYVADIQTLASKETLAAYPALIRDAFKYLSRGTADAKPNYEGHLAARFARVHSAAQAAVKKAGITAKPARISCVFPREGVQDNSVNRLLLMSSSERHLPSVPMAFFMDTPPKRPAGAV